MRAHIGAVGLLAGCAAGELAIDDGTGTTGGPSTGWTDAPWEQPTAPSTTPTTRPPDPYADATLRILTPISGDFLAIEDAQVFEAELVDANGDPLDGAEITWSSSIDSGWTRSGASFDDRPLDVGTHDITATVRLPNGDRLSYTAGGVLVQSVYAGTYSGLFTATGSYLGIAFACNGAGTTSVEAYGEEITGDADCLVSLLGFDLPLAFVFELENAAGVVTGTAGADLFGLLTYDFPATGTLQPFTGEGLSITFAGSVPFTNVDIDGTYDAARVSLTP